MAGNATMLPATSIAQVQMPAITVRRSTRSDRRPTGYCVTTAARMLTAMKMAMLSVSKPLKRAYTGPIEKIMEEIRPDAVIATTPSGVSRYRSRSRTLCGAALAGTGWADTTMGTMANEISTETSMKGVAVCGFD